MMLDDQLRDELTQAAARIESDTDSALTRVVLVGRQRQRVRRAGSAVLLAAVVTTAAFGISRADLGDLGRHPQPASHSSHPTLPGASHDEHSNTALTGIWQSRPQSTRRVREAITAAGLSRTDADRAVGTAKRWRVSVSFTQNGGGPVATPETWDPTTPGVSLRLDKPRPYELLPHHRLLMHRSGVVGPRLMFSYQLVGNRLTLHYVNAAPHPLTRQAQARIVTWTFAPLLKVN